MRASPKIHTAVRVDDALRARIDALRPHYSTAWRDATVSDVLRVAIARGLEILERGGAPPRLKHKP
jgi:hypothetical protein